MLLDQQHRKGLVSHVDYQTQITRLKLQEEKKRHTVQCLLLEQQNKKRLLKWQLMQAEYQSRNK